MKKQNVLIVINRLNSITRICGLPVPGAAEKLSKWHRLHGCLWLVLLTYLFQWCLQIKFSQHLYDLQEALIYGMLEFCMHLSVYLAVVAGIINAMFYKQNQLQKVSQKFAKLDKFLKSSAEMSYSDMVRLHAAAGIIFVFLALQYVFTTTVQHEYLNVYVILSYISYNLNLLLFLTICLTLHTFVELLRRRMEALKFQLQKCVDQRVKVSLIGGNIMYSNFPCYDVYSYARYYKIAFDIVGLLNSVYGIQMLILSFLNLMAIIYNMYVSTMKKTKINSYPEMYLLLIHMLHSLIYLVSEFA